MSRFINGDGIEEFEREDLLNLAFQDIENNLESWRVFGNTVRYTTKENTWTVTRNDEFKVVIVDKNGKVNTWINTKTWSRLGKEFLKNHPEKRVK